MTTHRTPSIPPRPPRRLRTTPGGHQQAPPRTRPGPLARARHAIHQLAPETIEQIAKRVAQLLREEPPPAAAIHADRTADAGQEPTGLLTASQLAERLGVSRTWVYERARKLGAITLGDGPRARLRFDLDTAMQALAPTSTTKPPRPQRRRPRQRAPEPDLPLLPINRLGLRGILSAWARRRHGTER